MIMNTVIFSETDRNFFISSDDCCDATLPVTPYGHQISDCVWGEYEGCVFKVGNDLYFVPTQQVADADMLYIACDAQKIEGCLDDLCTRLALGESAAREVENAILDHLYRSRHAKTGEAFVVTSSGKTFRL
jgi:hypothetical protein